MLADGIGSHDPPTRTAKERPSAKASDEQRVDNSHSTGAVPNRGQTNAATAQAPGTTNNECASRKLVMRQNWLSNRIFKSFDDIVDHCCYAWNTLTDQPWKIISIARRDWAAVGAKTIR
jgi:hypothetical protein